jgi:hypothetical protein
MVRSALKERRQERFRLQWNASLLLDSKTIECRIKDISNSGFCCITNEPVRRGTRLQCRIAVPASTAGALDPVYLCCAIQVVEVQTGLEQGYALHCRF